MDSQWTDGWMVAKEGESIADNHRQQETSLLVWPVQSTRVQQSFSRLTPSGSIFMHFNEIWCVSLSLFLPCNVTPRICCNELSILHKWCVCGPVKDGGGGDFYLFLILAQCSARVCYCYCGCISTFNENKSPIVLLFFFLWMNDWLVVWPAAGCWMAVCLSLLLYRHCCRE